MNFMWLQLPIANQVCRNFTWFQEVQFGFSAISNDKLIPSCKVVHRHSVLHEPLVRLQDDVVAKPSIDLNIPEHNLSETVFSLNQKQEIPKKTSRNHPCS